MERSHVVWQDRKVDRADRQRVLGQRGRCIWFTGLSGSGKSTIAVELEARLNREGRAVYLLDGDNLRHGLCQDLGFEESGRRENIRRIGEVARLFVDAGILTITAFISPYRADRDAVRARMDAGDFVEVYISTPLAVCEARDPKGLYRRVRAGEIGQFTGVSAPYEPPLRPEVVFDATDAAVQEGVEAVIRALADG